MKNVLILSSIIFLGVTECHAYKMVAAPGQRACLGEYRACTPKCNDVVNVPVAGDVEGDSVNACIKHCHTLYEECIQDGGHPNATELNNK